MLEALWSAGRLVIAGRQGFQRLYDLPERVIPDDVLGAPVPDETGMLRGLVERAVARPRRADRIGRGRAQPAARRDRPASAPHVDGAGRRGPPAARWRSPTAARRCSSRPARPGGCGRGAAVLLSPFDNLLWDRPFADRVLGFGT